MWHVNTLALMSFAFGLSDLSLPMLTPPPPPDPTDLLQIKLWKLEVKDHHKKMEDHDRNMEWVFALILGQCSPTIRDYIEASTEWATINCTSNAIQLLQLICQSLYHQVMRRKGTHALIDAEFALQWFRQTEQMSNHDYQEKLMELIEVYEHLGGEPSTLKTRIFAQVDYNHQSHYKMTIICP